MPKYDPLFSDLSAVDEFTDSYALSFDQIDKILNDPLPPSARLHPEWWGNESQPSTHVQAQAWLGAGWKVDHVDFQGEIVHFRRSRQSE